MFGDKILIIAITIGLILYEKSEFDILREECLNAWNRSCDEKKFYQNLTIHFIINIGFLACALIVIGGLLDNLQTAIQAVSSFQSFLIWIFPFLGGLVIFRAALFGSYIHLYDTKEISHIHQISTLLGLIIGLMLIFCSISLSAMLIHIGYRFANL